MGPGEATADEEGGSNQGPHMASGRPFSHGILFGGTGFKKKENEQLRGHLLQAAFPEDSSAQDLSEHCLVALTLSAWVVRVGIRQGGHQTRGVKPWLYLPLLLDFSESGLSRVSYSLLQSFPPTCVFPFVYIPVSASGFIPVSKTSSQVSSSCILRASDIQDVPWQLASTQAPGSSLASLPQGQHQAPGRSGLEKSISTAGCGHPRPGFPGKVGDTEAAQIPDS